MENWHLFLHVPVSKLLFSITFFYEVVALGIKHNPSTKITFLSP